MPSKPTRLFGSAIKTKLFVLFYRFYGFDRQFRRSMRGGTELRNLVRDNNVAGIANFLSKCPNEGQHYLTAAQYSIDGPESGRPSKSCLWGVIPTSSLGILHVAAFYDSLEALLFCYNRGLSLEQQSADEFCPLHYAAFGNATEVAAFLCSRNVEHLNKKVGVSELTPVTIAAASNAPQVLRTLINSGAVVEDRGGKKSAIAYAIQLRDTESLLMLLEQTEGVSQPLHGYSPLMKAVANRIPDAVELLLAHGADPNYSTEDGKSALSLACGSGDARTVQMLLDAGADVLKVDRQHKGPVFWAATSNDVEILKMVIKAGADPFLIDDKGNNALFSVCCSSASPSDSKQMWYPMFKILLELGLDVNQRNHARQLLLGGIVVRSDVDPDVFRLLIEHGADLSLKLPNNMTILETAQKCAPERVMTAINTALAARKQQDDE